MHSIMKIICILSQLHDLRNVYTYHSFGLRILLQVLVTSLMVGLASTPMEDKFCYQPGFENSLLKLVYRFISNPKK